METRRDVFHAIADPNRRQIIEMLAGKPLTLNAIAENFNVSRQAISVHVKVLTECGVIDITQNGRERICHARLEKLVDAYEWIEQYRSFWAQQFKSLDKYLRNQKEKSIKPKKRK